MSVRAFYDELAPRYHLIYADWEASIARQGTALASLISEHWPGARAVLDVAIGVGTQALGLSSRGYTVTGLDLSPLAVLRATKEAAKRGFDVPCVAADFCSLPVRANSADVLIACDNSLPHLDTPVDIAAALAEWFRIVRPGGGCLLSMRDYGTPPPAGTVEVHPYGERIWEGHTYRVQQAWTWHGSRYQVALEIVPIAGAEGEAATVVMADYLAIAPTHVAELLRSAGFERVERIDGRFFQPVLLGFKPRAS
jgi:ubiquinone/menaquinone biosynthesis C-methylase UbiE